MSINRLSFSLAKAEYFLTYATEPGRGGDKRQFWHVLMGFQSSVSLREALLSEVTIDLLQNAGENAFGTLFEAVVAITGPSGKSSMVRTIWIVHFGEDTARFVTAYPARLRE